MNSSLPHLRSSPALHDWRVWLQAVRPFSFTASITPLVVASALAFEVGSFDPLLAVLMLVASVACHAGANLANDYYDHLRGVDSPSSLGPSKVIQQDKLAPSAVRAGMLVAFALATAIGVAIVLIAGWPVLALALVSLAVAYAYTCGPRPLGYIALGEVAVFLTMGIGMVLGGFYVYTRSITPTAVVASIPIACLVAAILHVNNIRDAESDRAAGKRTLANLLSRGGSTLEFGVLVGLAYLVLPLLPIGNAALWPALLPVVSLPTGMALVAAVAHASDTATLNSTVRRTAGLHLRFGLLLAVGIVLATLLQLG